MSVKFIDDLEATGTGQFRAADGVTGKLTVWGGVGAAVLDTVQSELIFGSNDTSTGVSPDYVGARIQMYSSNSNGSQTGLKFLL